MKRTLTLLRAVAIGLFFSGPGSAAAQDATLVLGADPWCPMVCADAPDSPGFMVEAAQQALARHGYRVEYRNMPWSRALVSVEQGKIDGLLGANHYREAIVILPEYSYFWSQMGYAQHMRQPQVKDLSDASLTGLHFQLIQDYDYAGTTPLGPWLSTHPQQVSYNKGTDLLPRMLNLIMRGRGDITLDNLAVLQYTLKSLNLQDSFYTAPVSEPNKVYIGISRRHPNAQQIAELLDREMLTMRENGQLQALLLKYGVTTTLH